MCFITYDAGGNECASVDYVVNEEVCKRCTENKRFKQFVSETAIESVEKNYSLQLTRGVSYSKLHATARNTFFLIPDIWINKLMVPYLV